MLGRHRRMPGKVFAAARPAYGLQRIHMQQQQQQQTPHICRRLPKQRVPADGAVELSGIRGVEVVVELSKLNHWELILCLPVLVASYPCLASSPDHPSFLRRP